MEGGTTSEWSAGGGGGLYNSGTHEATVSRDVARGGSASLRARIQTPSEPTAGVRAFRWKEPRENRAAYYSAWVYLPQSYTLTGDPERGQFWNVFQFKSRSTNGRNDPVWAFYGTNDGNGGIYLRAGWGWGGTALSGPRSGDGVSGKYYEPLSRVPLPVGRWVHLQAHLKQSKDFDGALQFWQDGTKLFDFSGVRTSYDNCSYNAWCAANEWGVNLYSDGMRPNPATMYIDDAAIALEPMP